MRGCGVGFGFSAWYLLLVAVLGILSGCQSLRDLERFAVRHHSALTEALGLELRRPPSDSSFRYFFHQVDVTVLCAAICDWTIAQIPGSAADLDQLVCDGKTLRGSIEPTAGGGSAFIAQVTSLRRAGRGQLLRRRLTATVRPATQPAKTTRGRCCGSCSASWITSAQLSEEYLISAHVSALVPDHKSVVAYMDSNCQTTSISHIVQKIHLATRPNQTELKIV
jgi:hypothetical protein